jgi:DNA (cytosine-5)-methyltransferase 1
LDLFCGAGGAAMGYHRAGFEVVGVDIKPQPNYPFKFVQADALGFLKGFLGGVRIIRALRLERDNFDAIHASPPCQAYSTATKRNGTQGNHPDLIVPVRDMLIETGLPYVIENVVGAPLINPVLVCGTERGLETDGYRLRRHRLFETSWDTSHLFWGCVCDTDPRPVMDVSGGGPTHAPRQDKGGGRPYKGTADQVRRIMGMPWATKTECNEAVPPAYTEFIGRQLLAQIQVAA